MAEFPDLGEHCSWTECKELDFLPIVCHFCGKHFCKLHFLPEQHKCEKSIDKRTESLGKTEERYKCTMDKCKNWELVPLSCIACKIQVCLSHRHQDSHHCSQLKPNLERMAATKEHVKNILNKKVEPKKQRARSKAAQKTAAKVQLMKLKMKSQGQTSLPEGERVYFLVQPPQSCKKPAMGCFVCKNWSLGKTIDALADLTGTKNRNNVPDAPKLRLFRGEDERVAGDLDVKLAMLLSSEALFNGDSICLEYEEEAES